MAIWRQNIFPVCPCCGEWSSHAGHKNCPYDGHLWIDILTGIVKCDECGKEWSLENSRNYCSCGAEFEGGEIWSGMASEIGQIQNLTWARALNITKGTLQTRLIKAGNSGYERNEKWLIRW